MLNHKSPILSLLLLPPLLLPATVLASGAGAAEPLDATGSWAGWAVLLVFAIAYMFAIGEETLRLRKSMPVLVGAGVIWLLVAITYAEHGDSHQAEVLFRTGIEQYTELFLFLLAAMTYINAMSERGVFATLRAWLISRSMSLRSLYWLTGLSAFVISPIADNLTTALLMATVVVAVGGDNRRFVALGCINVVVAANAGGVFSPFGDITSLLVWQRGVLQFEQFFALFLPGLVNWLVPAVILFLALPKGQPVVAVQTPGEPLRLEQGGLIMALLFVITIAMAVTFESLLHLPAAVGMMTGLGMLKLYGYYLKRSAHSSDAHAEHGGKGGFDIFHSLERSEWDTLVFLYGILMGVAGLAAMGYLLVASEVTYGALGPTAANILVGMLSAVVENVPMMFTVLSMQPEMDLGQWLLVTLTTGTGGSLLAIGSAAGVVAMGQARGAYTFFVHLRWAWAIALGYAASIYVHFLVNAEAFA